MALGAKHHMPRGGERLRRLAAPGRRRQPVVAAAQQQGGNVRGHRLALGGGRGRHTPELTEGGRLGLARVEAVEAVGLDLPAPGRAIDGGPGLPAFDAVVEAVELLGILLEQAAVAALEVLREHAQQPQIAAAQRRHGLGNEGRLPLPHHVQQHHEKSGAIEPSRLGPILELQRELDRRSFGGLDGAFDLASNAGVAFTADRVGGAIGVEPFEGTTHDLRFVLLAVHLRRIHPVQDRGTDQPGMPPHHFERPAGAVGHAVEIDPWQREGGGEVGDIVGERRGRIHREVDLAPVERRAAARHDIALLLFGNLAAAGLRGLRGARVEAFEIGCRPARAALAQDDDIAAAADVGRLVPPIAFGQGIGAGIGRHQRRIAGTTREIDQRFQACAALGLQDRDLEPDLAALRKVTILGDDEDEAFDPVAARRLEGTALALQPRRGHGVSCQSQQQSCQDIREQPIHEGLLPHRSL